LRRLDDDLDSLTKFLRTISAPKGAMDAVQTFSREQHKSWQKAVDKITELLDGD
jgi:hypothetical protein